MASAQKKCGKCDKTVYPTEEIRCLDKSWHKGCLKCTTCGTALNIKTVIGYDKMPYCNAHRPSPKATVVADNPEMKRLQQLSNLQSNTAYHKDFSENKGKVTAVTDDVATTQAKEHQRNVSQAEYAGKRKDSAPQNPPADTHEQTKEDTETSKPTIGRVADYDPLNNKRGSLSRGYEPTSRVLHATTNETSVPEPTAKPDTNVSVKADEPPPAQKEEVPVPPPSDDVPQQSHGETQSTTGKFRAMYSYAAAADDELSFEENDVLVNCEMADEGWMRGQQEKTGTTGLFPSNYVENLP